MGYTQIECDTVRKYNQCRRILLIFFVDENYLYRNFQDNENLEIQVWIVHVQMDLYHSSLEECFNIFGWLISIHCCLHFSISSCGIHLAHNFPDFSSFWMILLVLAYDRPAPNNIFRVLICGFFSIKPRTTKFFHQ